jgi:hypothetical protein
MHSLNWKIGSENTENQLGKNGKKAQFEMKNQLNINGELAR